MVKHLYAAHRNLIAPSADRISADQEIKEAAHDSADCATAGCDHMRVHHTAKAPGDWTHDGSCSLCNCTTFTEINEK